MEGINVQDWALSIVQELSKISSLSTQSEVQSLLNVVADELQGFLNSFKSLQADLTGAQMHKSIVQKYRRQINSDSGEAFLYESYEEEKEDAKEKILYTQLLNYMVSGYYLLNKIRDILMEPITYAIAFKDDTGKMVYVDNVELEQLLSGVATLSNRIRLTRNNFARLEIDIKNIIQDLTVKKADDDPLYQHISNYVESHQVHKYIDRKGKERVAGFGSGYLWEAYRYMTLYKIPFSEESFSQAYEEARRGNLIYTKGGDVLSEQDKYGTTFALTSMATINIQLTDLIVALRQTSMQDVFTKLQAIFLQRVTAETNSALKNYVERDAEKLANLLKLK